MDKEDAVNLDPRKPIKLLNKRKEINDREKFKILCLENNEQERNRNSSSNNKKPTTMKTNTKITSVLNILNKI